MAPKLRAPDYVEPFIGWRVWSVVEVDCELRLCSLLFRTVWAPRTPALARCRRSEINLVYSGLAEHTAPCLRCSCGIYATRRSEHALPYLSRLFRLRPGSVHRVIGRVSAWGDIIEGSRGFRASCAYPEHLFVATGRRRFRSYLNGLPLPALPAEEIGLALADYGVPVELVDCATKKELAQLLELGSSSNQVLHPLA
jgi:hypothetical protein